MFDRKLADHLVIGDLDALVGRDATLIAAMTPQLQYRAGQPSATRSAPSRRVIGILFERDYRAHFRVIRLGCANQRASAKS